LPRRKIAERLGRTTSWVSWALRRGDNEAHLPVSVTVQIARDLAGLGPQPDRGAIVRLARRHRVTVSVIEQIAAADATDLSS